MVESTATCRIRAGDQLAIMCNTFMYSTIHSSFTGLKAFSVLGQK
jgi:hypothetical protein